MDKNWTHRKLCEDLASAKDTMFYEVPLGSVWGGLLNKTKVQIADVVCVKKSYTRFLLDIYECKLTREDFLSDIRRGKWKGYLEHCNRFYFAVVSGVASKKEIPDGVGLIVRGEKGWVTVKAATIRNVDIPYETMMALIFKKQSQGNLARRAEILVLANYGYYSHGNALKKILNKRVKKALLHYKEYEIQKRGGD